MLKDVQQSVGVLDEPQEETGIETTPPITHYASRQILKRDRNQGTIELDHIRPDPDQVRKVETKTENFEELVASVREHGVLEPITVRWIEQDKVYEIITGERRYRAAGAAGLKEIPAIRRDIDDTTKAVHQLVENVQRLDMSPLDEAIAYRRIMASTGETQEAVARRVGKRQPYISKVLAIEEGLTLEEKEQLQAKYSTSNISKSLIFEALQVKNKKIRAAILSGDLTVLEARRAIKTGDVPERKASRRYKTTLGPVTVRLEKADPAEDDYAKALEEALAQQTESAT